MLNCHCSFCKLVEKQRQKEPYLARQGESFEQWFKRIAELEKKEQDVR